MKVRISNAFLASYAEVRGGTTQILGAFPEWWGIPRLPSSLLIYGVVQVELERSEIEATFQLVASLHRPDGSVDPPVLQMQAARGPETTDTRDYDPAYLCMPFPIPLTIASEGRHQIEIGSQTQRVWLPFGVRVIAPPEGLSIGLGFGSSSSVGAQGPTGPTGPPGPR
jgi:hypothetical protein